MGIVALLASGYLRTQRKFAIITDIFLEVHGPCCAVTL